MSNEVPANPSQNQQIADSASNSNHLDTNATINLNVNVNGNADINNANDVGVSNTPNNNVILQKSGPSTIISDTISSVSTPSGVEVFDGEERRFVCPHCSHSFTRKHNLKSHLLIHTREKPFNCSICSSKFRRLHDLKRHEKLHTGEKPYQCKQCGKKFARLDALVRHNNRQGGCTLLVDDSLLRREQQSRDSSVSSSPHSTPLLNPIHSPSITPITQVPNLPGPVIQPRRSNYETNQWKLNNTLPSINRLPPLVNNTVDQSQIQLHAQIQAQAQAQAQTQSQPQQQQLQQQQQAQSQQQQQQQQQQSQNFDLLPYIRLLESRIATLETKLSATETKLAQLTYSIHHNNNQLDQNSNTNQTQVTSQILNASNPNRLPDQQQQQQQQQPFQFQLNT